MASTSGEAVTSDRDAGAGLAEHQVDPYGIAYLRSGGRAILKLRLFELVQKGYLIVIEKKQWYGTDRRLAVAPDSQDWQEAGTAGSVLALILQDTPDIQGDFQAGLPGGIEKRLQAVQAGAQAKWIADRPGGKPTTS